MKKKKNIQELEQEYAELEGSLPELNTNEVVDNLSEVNCQGCGTRLTQQEWQVCEDTCETCLHADTAGLIDDNLSELDFDE